eukprot:8752746-Pyramimonas_sp.AAC.1
MIFSSQHEVGSAKCFDSKSAPTKLTLRRRFVLSGRLDQLAPPRAGIPLARRCRSALRSTSFTPRRNSSSSSITKSSMRYLS